MPGPACGSVALEIKKFRGCSVPRCSGSGRCSEVYTSEMVAMVAVEIPDICHQHITNSMSHLRESTRHLHMYTAQNALCVAPRANIVSPFTFARGTTYWIRDGKIVRHSHVCIRNCNKPVYIQRHSRTCASKHRTHK